MERVRIWTRHGSTGHDPVRNSRSSIIRGERSSLFETVRMSRMGFSRKVSSQAAQTARDLTTKLGANANGKRSTTPLHRIAAGNEKIGQSLRGSSVAAATDRKR